MFRAETTRMKNIVIQGLGFVGSAMAVAVASKLNNENEPFFHVTGIDLPSRIGQERIDCINSGKFPFKINDSKLSGELKKAVVRGNLKATSETYGTAQYVPMVKIVILLVNHLIPQRKSPRTSYLLAIKNRSTCL